MLAAINATLEGHAAKDQQQYEVNNVPVSQIAMPKLISFRDRLLDLVKSEKDVRSIQQHIESEIASRKTAASGPELLLQTGHFGTVRTVSFSSDGRLLFSGAEDNSIKLWEISTGRELRTFSVESG
jgi:WD40 repeat protein